MGGMKSLFSAATVNMQLQRFINDNEDKLVTAFQVIGEDAINDAKDKPQSETYTDRTTNLRNSLGNKVSLNGKEVSTYVPSSGEGSGQAKSLLSELKAKGQIQLDLVAGMDYAAPVEALEGYSVLSGSIPTRSQIEKTIKEIVGE